MSSESDSEIEIIHSTKSLGTFNKLPKPSTPDINQQQHLPSLSSILISSSTKKENENKTKSPSLSPISKRNNLNPSNKLKTRLLSTSPTRVRSNLKRPTENNLKSTSLNTISTLGNSKLSGKNEPKSHSLGSNSTENPTKNLLGSHSPPTPRSKDHKKNKKRAHGSTDPGSETDPSSPNCSISPPPSRLNLKNIPPSKSQRNPPLTSDFTSQFYDPQAVGITKASAQPREDRECFIALESSPLSIGDPASDFVHTRIPKSNERDEGFFLSRLEFSSKSFQNEINHVPNRTSTSTPHEQFDSEHSPLNYDSAREAHDVQVVQFRSTLVQPNQNHETCAMSDLSSSSPKPNERPQQINLSSPALSLRSLDQEPGHEFNTWEMQSEELAYEPIPTSNESRENVIIELDSGDSLSVLDSMLGLSKPSSQSKKSFTEKGAREKKLGSPNNRQALSPAESYLQSHRSKSSIGHVHPVSNLLPRSRSAPQKPDEPLPTQLSQKAKGKQPAQTQETMADSEDDYNHFTDVVHDYDDLSHLHFPDRPMSPESDPLENPVLADKVSSSRIDKQAKAAEARLAREAKKAAKEQEKLQNRLNREANKLTLNRKETVSEVRMWVPRSLTQLKLHPFTKACEVLVERISTAEDCRMNQPGEIDDEGSDEPQGVVRWIRTTNKEWDEEKGSFVPLSLGHTHETSEPTVLIVWTGKEVDEIIASGPRQLVKKTEAIKAHYPQDQLFIVIYGLETILKAEKKRENAIIVNEARAKLSSQRNETTSYNSKSKQNSINNLPKNDPHKILKELEILKILTKAFIIRVEDKNEFANWLWEMTLEIGVRPYKARRQDLKSALRLEVTGTKGTNNEDTYIKMLASITRVTENEAKGIVAKFPTLSSLYLSWERGIEKNGIQWAEEMLIGCSKSNSITGVNSGRKIGKVTSKRIFDILYNVRNGDACI